jgi:hypothetical protein
VSSLVYNRLNQGLGSARSFYGSVFDIDTH